MKKTSKTDQHVVNNTWLKQALVFTKNHETFRFKTLQENHIVADAVHLQYPNWEAFDNDSKNWPDDKVKEEFQAAFKRKPTKKENRIDLTTSLYSYWASKAADRTEKPVKEGSSPKLTNRTYTRLTNADAKITTPQAKTCLEIIDQARGEEETISEAKLKEAFANKGAELKTRQLPWRIFQYYRPLLISQKVLKHD
jgi:hypothetical protein